MATELHNRQFGDQKNASGEYGGSPLDAKTSEALNNLTEAQLEKMLAQKRAEELAPVQSSDTLKPTNLTPAEMLKATEASPVPAGLTAAVSQDIKAIQARLTALLQGDEKKGWADLNTHVLGAAEQKPKNEDLN